MKDGEFFDYYQFLMVSPEADRAMVEWAVRLLAARYGKKNGQFVDEKRYNQVREAYRTLSDPEKREAYDKLREQHVAKQAPAAPAPAPAPAAASAPAEEEASGKPTEVKPVRPLSSGERRDPDKITIELEVTADDVVLERRKRQSLMSALYDILIRRPRNPELGRAEIARTVGVATDELEAAIWYLREQELLKTTNAGLYAITAQGVDWVEGGGLPHLQRREPGATSKQPTLDDKSRAMMPEPARRVV